MRIPDRARRNVLIDKVLYTGETGIFNRDGDTSALYPMGIIIPDRTIHKWIIVNALHPGVTGKIIWDGYI